MSEGMGTHYLPTDVPEGTGHLHLTGGGFTPYVRHRGEWVVGHLAILPPWTTDTPTEPGWYWLRLRDAVDIVDVEQTDEGLCILWDAAPRDRVADMRGAFWSGPLQPPGVPE